MTDWDGVGLVTASRYRRSVIESLTAGPATPTDIGDDIKVDITHVSRALRELREAGYVQLLVDESRTKGRYYGLTAQGESLAEDLADLNEIVVEADDE